MSEGVLTKEMLTDGLREFGKMKANCGTCIYWSQRPIEDAPESAGYCRRYPPVPHEAYMFGQFPVTIIEEWCGEHEGGEE